MNTKSLIGIALVVVGVGAVSYLYGMLKDNSDQQ